MDRIERGLEPTDDELAAREADAAAAEAAAIGGPAPSDGADEATQPVIEGGGGYAEGFELAEEELIRHASHEDNLVNPAGDEIPVVAEEASATVVYGEPDEVSPNAVVRDPEAGPADPGEGPGIATER